MRAGWRILLGLVWAAYLTGSAFAQTLSTAVDCDASDPKDCEEVKLTDAFLNHDYNVFWKAAGAADLGISMTCTA